jgi:ribosomal protein S18 acetylase RimI-like enzyme
VSRLRSLALATDIDVLPPDRVVEERDGYLLVRSPSNPRHYWGNFLVFDEPPREGDGRRWEALFEEAFADEPRARHRTFAWDTVRGEAGAAAGEFVARGYNLEESVGLVARAEQVRPHPRRSKDVIVRSLDSAAGADAELWEAVVELQVATRDEGHDEDAFRAFMRQRLEDLRTHFRDGRGSWYVALDRSSGELAASCGVVVTDGRGRFQTVATAAPFRRRGIASRLVVEAARRSAAEHGADTFVIVADLGYHALPLYESLGFERAEHVVAVCRWPPGG